MKNEPFEFEGLSLERTDGATSTGVIRHHAAADCSTLTGCPFHRPSEHHMADWPMTIDGGLILRVCEHAHTHPDPDSTAFMREAHGAVFDDHYCDGCCHEPVEPVAPAEMAAARAGLEQLARSLERSDIDRSTAVERN